MIKRNTTLLLLSANVCAMPFVTPALAADIGSYEMSAYADTPGGRAVLAGDYDAAIEAASRPVLPREPLAELVSATNLCVAHTLKRDLETAAESCDEAVSLASRVDAQSQDRFRRNTTMVKALSNRGVLEAVSGDYTAAAKDFRAAASLSAEVEQKNMPNRNLAYLEASTGYRLAVAETAEPRD